MAKDDIERLFGSFLGKKKDQPAPKLTTTDAPNIKMFMFQLLNAYAEYVDGDGLRWGKSFAHTKKGKQYRVTITLEEEL